MPATAEDRSRRCAIKTGRLTHERAEEIKLKRDLLSRGSLIGNASSEARQHQSDNVRTCPAHDRESPSDSKQVDSVQGVAATNTDRLRSAHSRVLTARGALGHRTTMHPARPTVHGGSAVAADAPHARQATTSSGRRADAGLARELSEFARQLTVEPDPAAVQQHIVNSALIEIDGAVAAAITLVKGKEVSTTARTADIAEHVDALQYRTGEGPCLSSLREQGTVRSDDLSHETRWPKFAGAATELGVRSMLSFQLFVEANNLGALNLYADHPGAFSDDDESTGLLLASHAAIAMGGAATEANLRAALESRDLIGQAKGILMERYKVDAQ